LVNARIATGKPYTDPDFKPDLSSLFDPEVDEGRLSKYEKMEWKRASEIFENPQIFHEGITPDDI
jgi:hypothetical protein